MQLIEITMQSGRMARIAHTGENEAVRVAFSLAPFEEAFPGGRPALLVRRKGDAQAYPVALTVEGDTAYWTVTAADTAVAGFGQCELQWYAGDTLAKSDKFDFLVVQALEAGAEPPDAPSKRWFDAIQSQIGDLDDLTTKAKENLVAAINEAARTGSGGAGSIDMQVSGGYIQYSTDGGATWENLIAVADLKGEPGEKGEPGADGFSPSATVEETADGAKITITDKNGTTEATVKNGTDGAPGKDGEDGAPGADGYSPSATVSAVNGGARIVIEDKNGTTAATIMNGGTGPKGDPGDDGVTPNIQIGTVTTLPAGSQATASVSGTAENPLLNLGIPKGDNGDGAAGGNDLSLGLTGAAAGQIAKISAVDADGKPTAWTPVDMPSGGGGGSSGTWEKVAEATTTEIVNEIRLSFDACKAVYIEFQYGAVEGDLGVIGIYPNPQTQLYTSEARVCAARQTTSTTNKRGYIFCTIDRRKGTQWVATSQTFFRGDGEFGSITPGNSMNCDIWVFDDNTWASFLWKGRLTNTDSINSVGAYGAGMNIGTTLTVWGIKV